MTHTTMILMWGLLGWTAAKRTSLQVEATNGFISFRETGTLTPEAGVATLIIKIDVMGHLHHVEEFHQMVVNKKNPVDKRSRVPAETERYINDLKAMAEMLSEEEKRRPNRSIGEFLAGLLGLYNTAEIHNIKGRLEHTNDAVRDTVVEADAIKEYAEQNNANIMQIKDVLKDNFNLLRGIRYNELALDIWMDLKDRTEAVLETCTAAMNHKLSWRVMNLIDMKALWARLIRQIDNHGWIAALGNWQNLFQMDWSFAASRGQLWLIARIPTLDKDNTRMNLYQWDARPVAVNGTLIEVTPEKRFLAVDRSTNATIGLTETDLQACTKIGRDFICTQPLVRYMEGTGTCIQALWTGSKTETQQRCHMTIAPLRTSAWSINDGFVIVTEERMDLIVKCKGATQFTKTVEKGMWKVTAAPGCAVTSSRWALLDGQGSTVITTVTEMTEEAVVNWLPEELAKDRLEGIIQPQTVASAKAKVEYELSRSGFSTTEIVTITLATVAIVLVAGFIAFLWWRLRKTTLFPRRGASQEEKETLELKPMGEIEGEDEASA